MLRDSEDPQEVSESSLLQAYVNYMLGGSELSDAEGLGLNFRIRQHLLAAFAHELYRRTDSVMARRDAETWLGEYFRDRGLMIAPGQVVQSLLDRRVLAERDGQVAFRHPAFLQLFTAQWMLEDAVFAEEMTVDALRHAEVVKHAAGLRRSDRDLLARVGEQVLGATAELRASLDIGAFDQTLTRDAAEPKNLEEIRERLLTVPEQPSERSVDASLDRLEDTFDQDDEPELPARPFDEYVDALQLLSDVLRNSELVDDFELKSDLLKEAVRAWSLLAAIVPIEPDIDGEMLDLITSALGEPKDGSDLQREVRRVLRLLTLVFVSIVAAGELGSVHLGSAIDSALGDDDVMGSPTRGWVLTMLYCQLELPRWAEQLVKLYERYPEHVFLREVIESFALHLYRTTTDEGQASVLEAFLANVFATTGGRGPDKVAARAIERSQVLEDLRTGRLRAQKLAPEPALLADSVTTAVDSA